MNTEHYRSAFVQEGSQQSYAQAGVHPFKSGHNKVAHKQECIRSRVVTTKLCTSRSAFVQEWSQQSYAQAGVHSFKSGRNKVTHKQECIRSRADITKLRTSRSAFV